MNAGDAMTPRQVLDLCHRLLELARKAGADQAEAAASWRRDAETHVENGAVHTVQSGEETTWGLRVLVGNQQGFVTANDLEDGLLAERAAEAVAQARANPADPFVGLPAPLPVEAVAGLHDPAIEAVGSAETTALAARMVERVRAMDPRVRIDNGSVSAVVGTHALASTAGIQVSERSSLVDASLFGMAVDGNEVASFDYDNAPSRLWSGFEGEVDACCRRFVDKCLTGLGAGTGESFRGPVVLSPEAVVEFLLPTLVGAMCADAVRKGRSPLASKSHGQVASRLFTLWEDGRLPGGPTSSAFDREGLPVQRRRLVDAGVLQGFLYNHYEARAAGGNAASTGNAAGGVGSLPGVGPHRLEVDAGSVALDALVASGEKAVWVGRYSGSTNPVTGDFSGVAKNGFLLEHGSRRPVREVLISGNVFELLERISALSRERTCIGGAALVPAIRAEDVSITAG